MTCWSRLREAILAGLVAGAVIALTWVVPALFLHATPVKSTKIFQFNQIVVKNSSCRFLARRQHLEADFGFFDEMTFLSLDALKFYVYVDP
jgi:hypothetical protein